MAAAGEGNRFGGAKQFSRLGNRCVIDWTVQRAARWSEGVVVVLPEARAVGADAWQLSDPDGDCAGQVVAVAGGVLRSDSVRRGLSRVPDDAEIVLVHDGARPLATDGVFERVIQAVRAGADAAIPVIDLTDTIRWRGGGTADRRKLAAVQTPQAFEPARCGPPTPPVPTRPMTPPWWRQPVRPWSRWTATAAISRSPNPTTS